MDAGIRTEIGDRVRGLREGKKVSLRQFAIDAGFNPNVLSRIERGEHNMTLDTLFRLSRSLGVTPTDLLHDLS
jgi:transcriptional regulator with XRE-family HTH domain